MNLETIYRKYFHDVFRYVCALSGNESLAEEIAQETFVKALKNIKQFDGRKDIRAWLFTIAKHTYYRECRRRRIYAEGEIPETTQDPAPQILDRIVRNETVQRAAYRADLLPEPYREVFRLRIYGELSFEQIGNCYGKSAGWARVTCYRARQMIQKQMRQEDQADGKD